MIIGFSGKRKAGKTTAASALERSYPETIRSYSFAYPIKEACRLIFGWGDDRLYGDLKEEVDPFFGVSSRFAQQTLGTEWGRDTIHSDLWILIAQKYYDNLDKDRVMLIQDVRFDNEYEFIKRNNGALFSIYNPEVEDSEYSAHASENSLTYEPDYTIFNDCSFQEFESRVVLMVSDVCNLKEIGKRRMQRTNQEILEKLDDDFKWKAPPATGAEPDFSKYVGY